MTHPPTSLLGRSLLSLAAAASLALSLGAGCMDVGSEDGDFLAVVTCPAQLRLWTPTDAGGKASSYAKGEIVSFKGNAFQARQSFVTSPDWFPDVVLAIWLPVQCDGGGAVQQPPAQPPAQQPPAQQPPANNGGAVAGGVFDANLADLVSSRLFSIKVSSNFDPTGNFGQVTNVAVAGVADVKNLVASGVATQTITNAGGVEDLIVTVKATNERRLHIRRNKALGVIEAVMVGAPSDQRSPFATRVRKENGVLTHTLACDVSNNQKNDLFAKETVDAQLNDLQTQTATPGGINGIATIAEAREIVGDLRFPGLKGF